MQQFKEQIAFINFPVRNNSIGICFLFHKIWRGTFCFCVAYKIYVQTIQNVSISYMWWTIAFIPTRCRFCLVSFTPLSFILLHCSCRTYKWNRTAYTVDGDFSWLESESSSEVWGFRRFINHICAHCKNKKTRACKNIRRTKSLTCSIWHKILLPKTVLPIYLGMNLQSKKHCIFF